MRCDMPISPLPCAAPTALPKVLVESDDDDPDANPDLEIKVGRGCVALGGLLRHGRVRSWVGVFLDGCVGVRRGRGATTYQAADRKGTPLA